LELYQGDYFELAVTLYEVDGTTPRNLTGMTPRAQVRTTAEDSTVLLEFDITIDDDPTTGQLTLSAASAQTALLPKKAVWDFQLTDAGDRTRTYLRGSVVATREVTR